MYIPAFLHDSGCLNKEMVMDKSAESQYGCMELPNANYSKMWYKKEAEYVAIALIGTHTAVRYEIQYLTCEHTP